MNLVRYSRQINWADPREDYAQIYQMREDNLRSVAKSKGAVQALLKYYSTHWAEFICDWGMTSDPRELDKDMIHKPFILYKRQVEYVNWIYERYTNRERGLLEKFRGAGATWIDAAVASIVWLTRPMQVVGFGSRKKEMVDNGDNDSDSILWKVRTFIDELPSIFLPPNHQEGRKWGVVPNLANGSLIKGEIGDEIGRGGRASLYFPDEFAHLEHQDLAESSLSETADCVIYVSTVNGVGNRYYQLRHFLPDEQVFVFDWSEDDRKRLNPSLPPEEEPWFKKKKAELMPTVFASQILRDYNAAVANSFISSELLRQAFDSKVSTIVQPPQTAWRIGVDASGMGNDKTVIHRRRGRISLPQIVLEKVDGVMLANRVEKESKLLLKSGPLELIGIERDGPGGSCADQLMYGPFASLVQAVHTGARVGDGSNYNLRAWLHDQAKEYLEGNLVHLERDPVFESQATALQFSYKGGLLLIESKDDYRRRFSSGKSKVEKMSGKSPDRWDAFILTFLPPRSKPIRQVNVNPSEFDQAPQWKPLDRVVGY